MWATQCGVGPAGGARAAGPPPRRGLRAGDYTRARLPQSGPAARRLGRARAAYWISAPSLPGRCVRIGRQGLRKLADFGVPTLRRASGGASGGWGSFGSLTPAGWAGPCGSLPLAGLLSLLEDATKWRRRGAELWRETVGRGVFGRGPRRKRCLFPGRRACPGPAGLGWGLRAAHVTWGAGPGSRLGGAGLDPARPAVQSSGA